MATKVLDSWALIALFNEEPAAEDVEKLLHAATSGRHTLLMHVINWGEIYYSVFRAVSREAAEQKAREIAAMPIEIVPVSQDLELAREAFLSVLSGLYHPRVDYPEPASHMPISIQEPLVNPTPAGGVQLEWHRRGASAEVELIPGGEIVVYVSRASSHSPPT